MKTCTHINPQVPWNNGGHAGRPKGACEHQPKEQIPVLVQSKLNDAHMRLQRDKGSSQEDEGGGHQVQPHKWSPDYWNNDGHAGRPKGACEHQPKEQIPVLVQSKFNDAHMRLQRDKGSSQEDEGGGHQVQPHKWSPDYWNNDRHAGRPKGACEHQPKEQIPVLL